MTSLKSLDSKTGMRLVGIESIFLYEQANSGEVVGPENSTKAPHHQFSHASSSGSCPKRHKGLINQPLITFDRSGTLNSFAKHHNPGMYWSTCRIPIVSIF